MKLTKYCKHYGRSIRNSARFTINEFKRAQRRISAIDTDQQVRIGQLAESSSRSNRRPSTVPLKDVANA